MVVLGGGGGLLRFAVCCAPVWVCTTHLWICLHSGGCVLHTPLDGRGCGRALRCCQSLLQNVLQRYLGTSLIRNCTPLGPYSRIMLKARRCPWGKGLVFVCEVTMYWQTLKRFYISRGVLDTRVAVSNTHVGVLNTRAGRWAVHTHLKDADADVPCAAIAISSEMSFKSVSCTRVGYADVLTDRDMSSTHLRVCSAHPPLRLSLRSRSNVCPYR